MVSCARVHGVSSRTARARVAHLAMKIQCQHFFGVVGVDFVDYILDYNTAYVALQRILRDRDSGKICMSHHRDGFCIQRFFL